MICKTKENEMFFNNLKNFIINAPDELRNAFLDEFSDKLDSIDNFVSKWADTIEIYGNKKLVSEIEQAEKDFVEGKGIEWQPGVYKQYKNNKKEQ